MRRALSTLSPHPVRNLREQASRSDEGPDLATSGLMVRDGARAPPHHKGLMTQQRYLTLRSRCESTVAKRGQVICPSCQSVAVDRAPKSPAESPTSRTHTRGVSRSSRTLGAECDGRFGDGLTSAEQSGRRSRVVLTSRRRHQALRKCPQCDGDNKARSPGRARRNPLKPFARGMPGETGVTVVTTLVCFLFFAREAAGANRAPGIPCALTLARDIIR